MGSSFDLLHPSLRHHIVNTLGWGSLRPLQDATIEPLCGGDHALLLAPTAGGKTEAATFPVLSRMATEEWQGLSVLYLAPLRALLNNLEPRLVHYGGFVGRRVGKWHGDIGPTERARMLAEPPDLLLTTPESLEAMLISQRVDHERLFADLHTVIVDEVHAFAADDRGWHMRAVLSRLERLTGRELQRIGLSATVGNPDELLDWLVAGSPSPAHVIDPPAPSGPAVAVELDYVASLENAAQVIAQLHGGEKRLVFVDSRSSVEKLGHALRGRGVTTFLSHGSLGREARREAEQAFEQGSDCVIVATSTLELGVDIGDLDRMIQIDAPSSVSGFLQRIGRTGRRAGSARNALFLTTDQDSLVKAAGLLRLWSTGHIEAAQPPPLPLHLMSQQVLALVLQQGAVGQALWREWFGDPFVLGDDVAEHVATIESFLVDNGFLHVDTGMWTIGAAADTAFGRRNFLDLTASFTAPPVFTVLAGRNEIGTVELDVLLIDPTSGGPRALLLGGRAWAVTHIDWTRRVVQVQPTDAPGNARWRGGTAALSYELCQSIRDVLTGADPPVTLTRRATAELADARTDHSETPDIGSVIATDAHGRVQWWTYAGLRANAMLAAMLRSAGIAVSSFGDLTIRFEDGVTSPAVHAAAKSGRPEPPNIAKDAVTGLKFSDALPPHLADQVIRARLEDRPAATSVLKGPIRQWTDRLE